MTVTLKIAALALVALLAACSSGGTDHAPVPPPTPTQEIVVTYEVDGTATGADITYATPSGTEQQQGADVPLTKAVGTTGDYAERGLQVFGFRHGDRVYLSAQNTGESGSLTCRIYSNSGYGVIISENTSRGAFAIATCEGQIP